MEHLRKQTPRNESDGFLYKPLVNPRSNQNKRFVEVMKITSIHKDTELEPNNLNLRTFKEAEKTVLKELEAKIGICLPKENLDQVSEFLKSKLMYQVTCSVFELHEFSNKIMKVIERFENFGQSDWKITLGCQEFLFHVTEEGCVKFNPFDLVQNPLELKKRPADLRLPKSKIEVLKNYEDSMIEAFLNLDSIQVNHKDFIKLTQKSEQLIKNQVKSLKKEENEAKSIRQELEWQREELKFYKNEAKFIKNTKMCKESILESEITNLREKRVSIAQSFENIEKLQEKLDDQKEKIVKILVDLQTFCENLGKVQETHETPEKLQKEIMILEIQLKDLESQYKKNSFEESLKLQINRLKTKISSLKTLNAISNTISTTNSAKSIMKSFNKVYSVNKFQARSPAGTNFCSPLAANAINRNLADKKTASLSQIQIVKADRSLSVSQRDGLRKTLDLNKAETIGSEVAQQQGKLVRKQILTPEGKFKIMRGDTKKIGKEFDLRKSLDDEEDLIGLSVDKRMFSTFTKGDEGNKFQDDKAKFWEQVEELRNLIQDSISQIINN